MCRRENECFSVAFPHRTKLKNIQKSNRFARWYVDTEDEYRCQFSFERNILFCARGNDEIAVFRESCISTRQNENENFVILRTSTANGNRQIKRTIRFIGAIHRCVLSAVVSKRSFCVQCACVRDSVLTSPHSRISCSRRGVLGCDC